MINSDDKNNNSNVNKRSVGERLMVNGGMSKHNHIDSTHHATDPHFQPQLRWPDLCAQLFLHIGAIYGLAFQFYTIKFYTIIWCEYLFCVPIGLEFVFVSFFCSFAIHDICFTFVFLQFSHL